MKAAEKRRPVLGDALVVLFILAAAALTLLLLPNPEPAGLTVLVTVEGEPVWACPLDEADRPVRYTVDGKYPLTLEVTPTGVRVAESSCPGGDCRHTGTLSKAGGQIICLPNRTVVTLQGDDLFYDAVTG